VHHLVLILLRKIYNALSLSHLFLSVYFIFVSRLSAQRTAEVEHISSKVVAKTVIALADQQMIALVLPASLRIDLDKMREILRAKEIRLAHEAEFTSAFPDCEVGAMPPFGNLYGLPVYVEKRLAEQETIVFPAGTHTETMSLKYADFERLVEPRTLTFARARSDV
jgi:Ala-tRNA(Pro) deacylase